MPMRVGHCGATPTAASTLTGATFSMTLTSSLRILDLCEFFSDRGGGVRSYLERMGKAAAGAGHALTVVAPGREHSVCQHAGMRLIRYPAPPMPYDSTYRVPWRIDFMRRVVAEERP